MWITKHSWSQTHPHADHQALLVTNTSTCGSPSTPGHKHIHTRITKHSWSQTHPHVDHQALLVSNTSTCRSTSTTSHKHIHMWIILEQLHITKQPSVCCFLVSVENVAHTRLQLIPVLGSQPAGDARHKPGSRLPLLSARPAVTHATLKRAANNFDAW